MAWRAGDALFPFGGGSACRNRMQRQPRQARDTGEIPVEREHADAMLERNCRDQRIDGRQTYALGTGQPKNRGRLPVGSEAAIFRLARSKGVSLTTIDALI